MTTPTQPHPATPASAEADDTKRLNYLQDSGSTVEILPSHGGGWRFRVGGIHAAVSSDIRVAIDFLRGDHPPSAERGGDVLSDLVAAVDAEMAESWGCNSYHPSLRPALEAARRAALAAQPAATKPLFAAAVAARKWAELQADGHRMQLIQFDGGKGGPGSIDPWGVVMWGDQPAAQQGVPVALPEHPPADKYVDCGEARPLPMYHLSTLLQFGETCQQEMAPAAGLRAQHDRDSAELRRLCEARDQARRERDAARAEIAGLESSVGHLSAMVDGQTRLVQKAVAIMKALHESATPIDGPDMDACIPGHAFRVFVDGHAELMHALAVGPQITTPQPAQQVDGKGGVL